ncbi:MAG TPA: hypothetical protein PLP29_05625 [Candidatus Ozemobacteraceae bacterium]|nr:hypothetical protein [Candidatus Ozemobacteraceae bacterium]
MHRWLGGILAGLLVCVLCRCHAAQPVTNPAGRAWEAIERGNPLHYPEPERNSTATAPVELIPGMKIVTARGSWGVIDTVGGLIALFPGTTLRRSIDEYDLESGMVRLIVRRRRLPVVLAAGPSRIRIREGSCLATVSGGRMLSGTAELAVGNGPVRPLSSATVWGVPPASETPSILALTAIERVWYCAGARFWREAAMAALEAERLLAVGPGSIALRSRMIQEAMIALAHLDDAAGTGLARRVAEAVGRLPEAWYDAFERCLRLDETVIAGRMYQIFASLKTRPAIEDVRDLILRRLIVGNHAEPLPDAAGTASAVASLAPFWQDSWTYLSLVSCSLPVEPGRVTAYLAPDRIDTLGPRLSRQRIESVARGSIDRLEPQGLYHLIRGLWNIGQTDRAARLCDWFNAHHAATPWLDRARRFLGVGR